MHEQHQYIWRIDHQRRTKNGRVGDSNYFDYSPSHLSRLNRFACKQTKWHEDKLNERMSVVWGLKFLVYPENPIEIMDQKTNQN